MWPSQYLSQFFGAVYAAGVAFNNLGTGNAQDPLCRQEGKGLWLPVQTPEGIKKMYCEAIGEGKQITFNMKTGKIETITDPLKFLPANTILVCATGEAPLDPCSTQTQEYLTNFQFKVDTPNVPPNELFVFDACHPTYHCNSTLIDM